MTADHGRRFRALQERFGADIRLEFSSPRRGMVRVQLQRCTGMGPGWTDWAIERSVDIPYQVLEDRTLEWMVAQGMTGLEVLARQVVRHAMEEVSIPFLMD